jgi:hypothetical protein
MPPKGRRDPQPPEPESQPVVEIHRVRTLDELSRRPPAILDCFLTRCHVRLLRLALMRDLHGG